MELHWTPGVLMLVMTLLQLQSVSCNNLKEKIYTSVTSDYIRSCFRRLNGSSTIGCTSPISGDVGVLIYLDTVQDIEKLKDKSFAPYTVLVNPEMFSGQLMDSLNDLGHISGVILPTIDDPRGRWYGKRPAAGYSDDSQCPLSVDGCSDDIWNGPGSGNMWKTFSFPIFYIEDANTTESLFQCYQQHNNVTAGSLAWPLCSVEMKANMHAAKDSETCIRRSNLQNNLEPPHFCDPLSDINLHYFVKPRNETKADGSKVKSQPRSNLVITARLDGITMFDKTEIGFDSPTTGLVTLLSTAKIVSRTIRDRNLDMVNGVENVWFLFLNGESFDNTGSVRLLYNMKQDSFPHHQNITDNGKVNSNGTQPLLIVDNIKAIIELGQLSNIQSDTVYIHSYGTRQIKDKIKQYSSRQSLNSQESSRTELPPSSSQKFVDEQSDLDVVMLTNYDREYSNAYYHSLYDTPSYHGYNHSKGSAQSLVSHLTKVTRMLSQTILSVSTNSDQLIGDNDVGEVINDLLECYTVGASCNMFKQASSTDEGFPWNGDKPGPFSQYFGVNRSPHAIQTTALLQLFTGDIIDLGRDNNNGDEEIEESKQEESEFQKNKKRCLELNGGQAVYSYVYLVGPGCYDNTTVNCGKCYKTTVDVSDATSPAFIPEVMETYDWSSGHYPTWTESIWKEFSARSFLQGQPSHDHLVFGVGITVFLFSLVIVYWTDKYSNVIFPTSLGAEYRVNEAVAT